MATRLVFGCGYLGARVARRWLDRGDRVLAVTRSAERAARWADQGIEPLIADVCDDPLPIRLPRVDTVLYAIGYDRQASASIGDVYAGGLQRVLEALPADTGRVIYISSTGVYGTAEGGWVDEQTEPDPQRPGGKASLDAEANLAASPFAQRGIILRMAGLYGPDRIPFVDKLRRGEPLAAPAEGWLNLIHIDDAARITVEAADMSLADLPAGYPLVVCVCDGSAVERRDYYREAARLLGVPAPEFVDPDPLSAAAARAGSNRRVSSQRMVKLFPRPLQYPDYRAGLAGSVAGTGSLPVKSRAGHQGHNREG